MTREEAINEIKSWAIPSKKGREVLETLIPELRENKDENVKNKSGYYKAGKFWKASTLWNATKNKIPQRVSNKYILQECTWNIGTLQRFADEVKNVQEVSLDYPIILDMNGNIIDGAHRVVKAYLEGKDIDIVYIGDDEWPEPDYDEEKAVKESEDERIRKFLIQHVSEWIGCIEHDLKISSKDIESERELAMFKAGLAYLEKQKECVADNSKTSTDEDERIINQLITLVNSAGEVLLIPTNKEELVAWLNKYKESLHISETCKENANSFADGIIEVRSFQRGMEEGRKLEKQKEQKPQTDDEKEYIRTIKSIISDFIRDKKPENLAYYQRIYDWLDGRHVPFSCGHEKGQPADPVFSKQEYESYPIISEDTTSVKPRELDGKTLLYTADKSYQIGFRDGVASVKPTEWSEENEKDVAHIIRILDDCYAYGKHDLSKTDHENLVGTLKSLCLQPKLEWSEEDEHRRDGIIQWLREYQAKFNLKYDSLSIESIESLIDWLKSIRPSWKPNEEQMEALDKARRFIPYNCDVLESLYIQLKNL